MAACPKCTHPRVVKAGKVRGAQCWLCRGCGYQFTRTTPRGKPLWQKSLAVFLYCHGLSINALSKMFGVRASSVLKWIRRYAVEHDEKPAPTGKALIIEVDELWHFLKKNGTNSGSGRLLIVIQVASWTGNVGVVMQQGIINLLSSLYRFCAVWHTRPMKTAMSANPYKNHRFPAEIISHAVWLYFRFCLSYRDVEELLFARGVTVTYEAIRKWCRKFGQRYANQLRHRRPKPGDKWHLDEVFLNIHGERHYLWRAVDQEGNILDILVQRRRDKQAAKTFFRKLLKGLTYVPRVIVTDRLKSYGAAIRELLPGVEHRQHRYLNNRAENSHQPTRQRERRMQGFKSPGHAQRFLSAYGLIAQHFRLRRHRSSASAYWQEMRHRFDTWHDLTTLATAA